MDEIQALIRKDRKEKWDNLVKLREELKKLEEEMRVECLTTKLAEREENRRRLELTKLEEDRRIYNNRLQGKTKFVADKFEESVKSYKKKLEESFENMKAQKEKYRKLNAKFLKKKKDFDKANIWYESAVEDVRQFC